MKQEKVYHQYDLTGLGRAQADELFMRRALDLALLAEGDTSPNPMVGCVLVRDGDIIGEGWHYRAGEPHAEVMALKDANYRVRGATAYVTLEPCSHFGRVGPCCQALVRAGVARVVSACTDPNPKVAGAGLRYLRENGVEVTEGVCEAEALALNEKFLFAITHDRPFVSLKYAMTLDGKIATAAGDSEWVTGEEARREAHHLRKAHDAVLVGVGTVLADNPELTTRLVKGRNALRIVLDSRLRLPMTAAVLNDAAATLIFTGSHYDEDRLAALQQLANVEVVQVPEQDGHVDLRAVLTMLAERKIRSVLVEGGSEVLGSFLDRGFVDRVYAFVAPKLCGGSGLTAVGGRGVQLMEQSLQLQDLTVRRLGEDVLLTGKV